MNLELSIYLRDTKTLARTIRFKFSFLADQINSMLIKLYGESMVDLARPNTWKYYLNASGEYHQLDQPMHVVSWDTGETILFTKSNLDIHAKTKEVYAYGTVQYKELVNQYPNQEDLILGILYPCDINKAIDAEDGDILSYPSHLIEDNEYSLPRKLEDWVKKYLRRYYNVQFSNHHDLYNPASLGVMYLHLTPVIMNLRLEMTNTNEAHSFEINQYLKSRGITSDVLRFLTKKQLLKLYKNINYIQRNPGSNSMLSQLIEWVLSDRNFPVSSYYMRHSTEGQVDTLKPVVQFKNTQFSSIRALGTDRNLTLSQILDRESKDGRDNNRYISDELDRINDSFTHSKSDVVQTKVLESSMVIYDDVGQFSLENVLLNYWAYLSDTGHYRNIIRALNPRTGEYFSLSTKEALALSMYLAAKNYGWTLDEVPVFIAEYVPILPTPSIEFMLDVVDPIYLDTEIIREARKTQPIITQFTSTIDFADKVRDYHKTILRQNDMKALPTHVTGKAMAEVAISRMYRDVVIQLAPEGTTYTDWLNQIGLDLSEFEDYEYQLLYKDIINEAIGINDDNNSNLKDIQAAMIKLLKYLSSYSIQVLQDYSGSQLYDLKLTFPHPGFPEYLFKNNTNIPLTPIKVLSEYVRFMSDSRINIPVTTILDSYSLMRNKADINIAIGILENTSRRKTSWNLLLPKTTILSYE